MTPNWELIGAELAAQQHHARAAAQQSHPYPFAPVEQALHARVQPRYIHGNETLFHAVDFAEALGITADAYKRHRKRGRITEVQADQFATALGLHIDILWPDMRYEEDVA